MNLASVGLNCPLHFQAQLERTTWKYKKTPQSANKKPQSDSCVYFGETELSEYPHLFFRVLHSPDWGQPGGNEARLKIHQ